MDFWDILNIIADFWGILIGIASFIISIVTLINTGRIKTNINSYKEKRDYLKEIDPHIQQLKAYYETLKTDDRLVSSALVSVIEEIDELEINYESYLNSQNTKIMASISEIKKAIHGYQNSSSPSKKNLTQIKELLHTLYTRLEKAKKDGTNEH